MSFPLDCQCVFPGHQTHDLGVVRTLFCQRDTCRFLPQKPAEKKLDPCCHYLKKKLKNTHTRGAFSCLCFCAIVLCWLADGNGFVAGCYLGSGSGISISASSGVSVSVSVSGPVIMSCVLQMPLARGRSSVSCRRAP